MKKTPVRATMAGFTLLCAAGTAPAVADGTPFERAATDADLDIDTAAVARLNAPMVTALHNNGRPDARRLARREAPHG